MKEKLKILIEKCAAILDAESINEVWHFYNHDEYEMALEGLLIELTSAIQERGGDRNEKI